MLQELIKWCWHSTTQMVDVVGVRNWGHKSINYWGGHRQGSVFQFFFFAHSSELWVHFPDDDPLCLTCLYSGGVTRVTYSKGHWEADLAIAVAAACLYTLEIKWCTKGQWTSEITSEGVSRSTKCLFTSHQCTQKAHEGRKDGKTANNWFICHMISGKRESWNVGEITFCPSCIWLYS